MTTLLDFQKYASENQREANFQTLCDMMGGAGNVFIAYYGGDESYLVSMDRALQNFVLTEASGPLAAFILGGVYRRLESIHDCLHANSTAASPGGVVSKKNKGTEAK